MLEPAPLHLFPPLESRIIAWLVHVRAQLATKGLRLCTDCICALEDFLHKDLNLQTLPGLFESHPPTGSLLTSFITSLAANFLAAQFEPFWVGLPWMNSCLKADLKWVLLPVRAIGWKEHYPEQQRWPQKVGRLSWGWFCRCALV